MNYCLWSLQYLCSMDCIFSTSIFKLDGGMCKTASLFTIWKGFRTPFGGQSVRDNGERHSYIFLLLFWNRFFFSQMEGQQQQQKRKKSSGFCWGYKQLFSSQKVNENWRKRGNEKSCFVCPPWVEKSLMSLLLLPPPLYSSVSLHCRGKKTPFTTSTHIHSLWRRSSTTKESLWFFLKPAESLRQW